MDSRIDRLPATPPVTGSLQRGFKERTAQEREAFEHALEHGEKQPDEAVETVQPVPRKIRLFGLREPEEGGTQLDVVG